jgi:hypothetical protein
VWTLLETNRKKRSRNLKLELMLESLNSSTSKYEPKRTAIISEIVSFRVVINPVKLAALKWVRNNKKTRRKDYFLNILTYYLLIRDKWVNQYLIFFQFGS